MRVAIVDDELVVRNDLEMYINRFASEKRTKIITSTYSSGDQFLENYKMIFDIIIFDIDMPGTNGMDTAKKIREIDSSVIIMFITNIAQYAINGYEVDAVDYIIKPITYYEFSTKFRRAITKVAQKQDYFITKETEKGIRRIQISECSFVEVVSHYLYFNTVGKVYKVRGTMKSIEEELQPYNFVRVHKSFLVNMSYISNVQSKEIIIDDNSIPIGRSYKEIMMQEYIKYIRGES